MGFKSFMLGKAQVIFLLNRAEAAEVSSQDADVEKRECKRHE